MEYTQKLIKFKEISNIYCYKIKDKYYYFIGDIHNSRDNNINDNVSPTLVILQEWLIHNLNHCIMTDFYLEAEFTKHHKRFVYNQIPNLQTSSLLLLCQYYMHDCFIINKNHLYQPYIHTHYADVRSYDTTTKICYADPYLILAYTQLELYTIKDINDLCVLIKYIIYHYRIIFDGMLHPGKFEYFIQQYINISESLSLPIKDIINCQVNHLKNLTVNRNGITMHRIAGELLKLSEQEPLIANQIKDYILQKATLYSNILKERYENIDKYIDIENLLDGITRLSTLSMDAYVLSRMFVQKGNEIITYTGDNHCHHYKEFFEEYLHQIAI